MQVQTGAAELVLAGGVESMSQAEFYAMGMRWGVKGGAYARGSPRAPARHGRRTHHPVPGGMIETAENLRRQYEIIRADQDELALRSHQRAVAAQQDGKFAQEIVPVAVPPARGTCWSTATSIRARTPRSSARETAPADVAGEAEATVTAGNASGQNDGAAVCIVTHPEKAAELGLSPFARLVSWAVAGVAPATMGIGPVPSTGERWSAQD